MKVFQNLSSLAELLCVRLYPIDKLLPQMWDMSTIPKTIEFYSPL